MLNSDNSSVGSSSLTFQFIGNACGIFTGKCGTRILCDPWIMDGVFDGSWCHYPKLRTTVEDLLDVDAIYISHLHPDHFDERYFNFDYLKPIIVLDHGPNFLIKKLSQLGYKNLIKVKDGQTIEYKEFEITLFAPFAKHNFYDAAVGNLIDSAMLICCEGISAFNANDNTPTVDACNEILNSYGEINLAMLNYNAAGPYPSCFDNLTDAEKKSEHSRILQRNFGYIKELLGTLKPEYILPFAGAYVIGGDFYYKNEYLGTTTWDECANFLNSKDIDQTKVVLLREGTTFNIETGLSNVPYVPIDTDDMKNYIQNVLSKIKYPYQLESKPEANKLLSDVKLAAMRMKERMVRFGITSEFSILIQLGGKNYQIYPEFFLIENKEELEKRLECQLDERLLRRILDKQSHWNNAEIGAHISFIRVPNVYEPDLHTGLQFFHL